MNFRLLQTGLLAASLFAAGAASAQTSAPGPYYATPSWDQKLPAAQRFVVLSNWDNAAVLDRETGLVWERDPEQGGIETRFTGTFYQATLMCLGSSRGSRMGWRLPTITELLSLVERPSVVQASGYLPVGHPFLNIRDNGLYWSSSPSTITDWILTSSVMSAWPAATSKNSSLYVWCVRGPGTP